MEFSIHDNYNPNKMNYIITANIQTNKKGKKEVDVYTVGSQSDLKKYFGVQLTNGGFMATNCLDDIHIYSHISGVTVFHVHQIDKKLNYTFTIS